MKPKLSKEIWRYFVLFIMLFLSAINFNLLMKPCNFVTGGTPGLAIVLSHTFHVSSETIIYITYALMFLLSLIFLGFDSFFGVLIATIFYPLFVSLTSNINSFFQISYNDLFVISFFSGLISGFTNGVIYKYNFASSGLGVLGPIFNKLFKLPIASVNYWINVIIVLIGGYYFGFNIILYAIIFLYVSKIVSNKIILGVSNNKALIIRSNKLDDICKALYNDYAIDSILIKATGGYSAKNGHMAMFIVSNFKYSIVLDRIRRIDENVFCNTLDSYELGKKDEYL